MQGVARGWLREIRKLSGKSEAEVARLVGVAQSVYHRYETGQLTPSVPTAKAVSRVLGFSHWELFYPDEEDNKKRA